MTRFRRIATYAPALLLALLIAAPLSAQDGGLRREPGIIMTGGILHEFTAGEAIPAHYAVNLRTDGRIYKLTSDAATGASGVTIYACASGARNCKVQITGLATVISDAAIAVGDRVGPPAYTAGRVKTLAGAANPRVSLGWAFTGATDAAQSVTILLQILADPEPVRTAVCPLGACAAAPALLPPCNALRRTHCYR